MRELKAFARSEERGQTVEEDELSLLSLSLSSADPVLKMSAAEGQSDGGDDEVVQCHPSDHIAPDSVAFSPDDKLISYLVTPESALATFVFGFYLPQKEQRFLMKLPDGEFAEEGDGVVSPTEEKRRKSSGERGLGFTRYEWAQGPSGQMLMVPLPGGVRVAYAQSPIFVNLGLYLLDEFSFVRVVGLSGTLPVFCFCLLTWSGCVLRKNT